MIACVSELHTYWTFIWPILLYLFSCAYLQKAYRSITIAQRKQAEFVVALTLCACTIDIPSRCWHYVNFLPKTTVFGNYSTTSVRIFMQVISNRSRNDEETFATLSQGNWKMTKRPQSADIDKAPLPTDVSEGHHRTTTVWEIFILILGLEQGLSMPHAFPFSP